MRTVDAVVANAGLAHAIPATVAVNSFGAVATLQGLRPLLAASPEPRASATCSMASLFPADCRQLLVAQPRGARARHPERGARGLRGRHRPHVPCGGGHGARGVHRRVLHAPDHAAGHRGRRARAESLNAARRQRTGPAAHGSGACSRLSVFGGGVLPGDRQKALWHLRSGRCVLMVSWCGTSSRPDTNDIPTPCIRCTLPCARRAPADRRAGAGPPSPYTTVGEVLCQKGRDLGPQGPAF